MSPYLYSRGVIRAGIAASAAAAWMCLATPALSQDHDAAKARAIALVSANSKRALHGPDHTYTARDVIVDANGTQHVRLHRSYKGLRVIGGDMLVHSNAAGALLDVSLTTSREPSVDTRAKLSATDATGVAQREFTHLQPQGEPELVVYARSAAPVLAWDVQLAGMHPSGRPSHMHAIVDATRGTVLDSWDRIESVGGSGTGFYLGNVPLETTRTGNTYYLKDPSRGNQYTLNMWNSLFGFLFDDSDNVWGNGQWTDRQTAGVDAQYGAALTWDYYLNVHGRNGLANDGTGNYLRVHFPGAGTMSDAFWTDLCHCATFGDGNGKTDYPWVSLDTVAHEMSHGVNSYTAGLVGSGESGGLNESSSDIFAVMVEFYAQHPNFPPDYMIGRKLYVDPNAFLRNMMRPSADGKSPDCWYPGVGNLSNVHHIAGVSSHFYYLLAEGTTAGVPSPTCQAGDTLVATGRGTLKGIGHSKAEKIWYRALTVYMTSNTDFAGARAATLRAATDLYGAGSIEYNAVAAAWTAVNRN